MRLKSLALAAVLLPLPLALAAAEDPVVATVNGEAITLGQMRAMAAGLGEKVANVPDKALFPMLLENMIQQAAMAQAGEKGLTPDEVAGLALQRRAFLASAAMEKVAAAEPTDAEIQAAYDKAFGKAEPKTEYNASHILVDSEEAAKAVLADLAAGKPFGEVAAARSTGSSGPNNGDLGWFTLDMMVPEFASAVAAMKKGETSTAPVKTQFGWHIIHLADTRVKAAPKLEEVRDALAQQVRRERVEAEVKRLMEGAKVEKTEGIDPESLRPEAK